MEESEENNSLTASASVVKEGRKSSLLKSLFKKGTVNGQSLVQEETSNGIESDLSVKQQQTKDEVRWENVAQENTRCLHMKRCYEFVTNRKKSEEEIRPPSPILPKVMFDSNGDFEKEFYQAPAAPIEKKKKNHQIKITKDIVIDTKKVKQHIKNGVKFAFSQIGLVGLVICYVILGAIIIMKIESSYEKENQEKIERNRDDFFDNVRTSAEQLFNEYLKQNFHTKYNQYRNEEMLLEAEMYRKLNDKYKQPNSRKGSLIPDNQENYVYFNKILKRKVLRHLQNISTNTTDDDYYVTTMASSTSRTAINRSKRPKFDDKSLRERMKDRSKWYIELDRELFNMKLKEHLGIMYKDNEQMENKDQQSLVVQENVWNYPNALLYCATVITTIGYGNITPKSNIGKIFTIFYAIIGIPLMYMCWMKTGDLLAEIFINAYSRIIRFITRRLCKSRLKMPYSSTRFHENKEERMYEFEMEYDNENDKHVPIVATIGVLTAYIMAGAVIFSITEGWNILDGAYFCFITFTTIGFGDFVPGKRTLETEKRGVIALCCAYLLLGMLITTMCIKLMQDEVIAKVRLIAQRIGIGQ